MSRSGLAVFGRQRRRSAEQAGRAGSAGYVGLPPAEDAARSEVTLSKLELLVTRKLDGLLQGDYLGLLPGPGSEPGESREYHLGDDVRRMDWPVTARTTVPHVRQTIVDRELETWLAVDLSASLDFGTASCLKRDLAVAAVAAVAHLTIRGGNRIGAVTGTGEATHRIPARPGKRGAQALLRAVAGTERPHGGGRTDLAALVDSLNRPPRRRGMVAVISDFLAPPGWERPLRKLAVRHDVLAIEVLDPRELELPDVGVLELVDPESGAVHEVQTTPDVRARYAQAAAAQRATIADALRHGGVAHLRLRTDSDWLLDIVRFVAAQRHARTRGMTR